MTEAKKALRPTTIIPPHLYVEREADRQLNDIVNDMGRPGYVLVARQMGKTNLLINMKRRREELGELVLYKDLSTRFGSSRALFRNIVDSLVELSPSLFESASSVISAQRKEEGVEPTNEYDRHIRLLLKSAPSQRIIIVFDEIDSLVSASYSDAIFAQIRSMYFSRINYPEYERLTYVLSGVAEPTDLIKDKNISPFNIGEKIYLDDFSYNEYHDLVLRSDIRISDAVSKEIYSWTSGNPRMSWDVTSAVEDLVASGADVEPTSVRPIIEKMYLTRFDTAPVDHIRTLVEADPLVRNAVIAMRWNKGESLDERTKSRLYLSGISGMSSGELPRVKNRIIDAALSDAWLTQVSAGNRTLLEAAHDSFLAGAHEQVIRLTDEFIRGQSAGYELPVAMKAPLGISRYHTGDFVGASRDLASVLESDSIEPLGAAVRYYLASALLLTGRPVESIPLLQAASETDQFKWPSKLALGTAYLVLGAKENLEKIRILNQEIQAHFEAWGENAALTEDQAVILSSTYYNSGQAETAAGDIERACYYLDLSLDVAPTNMRPRILLQRSYILSDIDEKRKWTTEAVRMIVSERITFGDYRHVLSFTEQTLAWAFSMPLQLGLDELFHDLMNYAREVLYHHIQSELDVILRLSKAVTESLDRINLRPLLWYAIDNLIHENPSPKKKFDLIRQALRLGPGPRREEAKNLYLSTYPARRDALCVEDDDRYLILMNMVEAYNAKSHREALTWASLSDPSGESEAYFISLTYFIKMMSERELGNLSDAQKHAREMLALGEADPALVGNESVITINGFKDHAKEILSIRLPDPFRHLGRNQVITVRDTETGEVFSAKFKKVEGEVRSGRYQIKGS